METSATQPKKGGNGLMIAFVIVLALGIGTAVAYTMRKKKSTDSQSGGSSTDTGVAEGETAAHEVQTESEGQKQQREALQRDSAEKQKVAAMPISDLVNYRAANLTIKDGNKLVDVNNPGFVLRTLSASEVTALQEAQKNRVVTSRADGMNYGDTGDVMYSSFYN